VIRFAGLFAAIDQTNSTNAKVEAMVRYFASAPPHDAAWAVFFLTGRRLKRLVHGMAIGRWALAATGLSEWLLRESYAVVGDGAETAALILDQLPSLPPEELPLAAWIENRILPLRNLDPLDQQAQVIAWLQRLGRWERFTLLKLLTGELRVGVSQTLVVRALAQTAGLPPTTMAARLMGEWTPSAAWYQALLTPGATDEDRSRPYPFCLATPLENVETPADLSRVPGFSPIDLDAWLIEWKWDGIRAQLVKRDGLMHLWSRGEELINDRFPEVVDGGIGLPDGVVLDGEVLAFRDGRPLPFSALQQRIGRQKQVARKARDVPVVFMTFDVLEHEGRDIRLEPLSVRRRILEALVAAANTTGAPRSAPREGVPIARDALLPFEDDAEAQTSDAASSALQASATIAVHDWDELARRRRDSRLYGVEGLMLKRRDSSYGVGRKRGDWWKWKINPFTVDAVLIYAQPGSGKRASLLTDYTFGVWDQGELVPVAKAYSGLTNEEIAEMDRWIRRHTVERFGPVRHVEPVHVFELGFEAIARSTRHKSGIAVRFPRMLRWRRDKTAAEADTLDSLKAMIAGE
jgi:ATP-dependent DNA ligase